VSQESADWDKPQQASSLCCNLSQAIGSNINPNIEATNRLGTKEHELSNPNIEEPTDDEWRLIWCGTLRRSGNRPSVRLLTAKLPVPEFVVFTLVLLVGCAIPCLIGLQRYKNKMFVLSFSAGSLLSFAGAAIFLAYKLIPAIVHLTF